MQKTSIVAFRRGYRLQWEAAQESHVILYPEGMAKLNETAAAIDPASGDKLSLEVLVSDGGLKILSIILIKEWDSLSWYKR